MVMERFSSALLLPLFFLHSLTSPSTSLVEFFKVPVMDDVTTLENLHSCKKITKIRNMRWFSGPLRWATGEREVRVLLVVFHGKRGGKTGTQ